MSNLNMLGVNNGFPTGMTAEQLKPLAVVEVYIDGKRQNCLIIFVEKVARTFRGERWFVAILQNGNQIRCSQLNIVRLVNHSLTLE